MVSSRAEPAGSGHLHPERDVLAILRSFLLRIEDVSNFWVGFSGGADSTALLVALNELHSEFDINFQAVHFNHGLQVDAMSWQRHCQAFCQQRNIALHVAVLNIHSSLGPGPEGRARQQRYAAAEQLLGPGDVLLTAHHADDNAETLLINLMRGCGMDGIAGIPHIRALGDGRVARPFLGLQRSDLEAFLRTRDIKWLEDPSNLNQEFDRNFIRNGLLPILAQRWPGAVKSLNQVSSHARELTEIITKLLEAHYGHLILDGFTLALPPLLRLEPELQGLLLRQWLRDQDIITPPRRRLSEFLRQLNLTSSPGEHAELRWSGHLLKRSGSLLWLCTAPAPGPCPVLPWTSGMQLNLGNEAGTLELSGPQTNPPAGWAAGPRKAGDRMSLHEGGPRHTIKELMRNGGIPPWLREAVPVLYWDDRPVAVGDWLLHPDLHGFLKRNGLRYRWRPRHPLLCKLQSVSVQLPNQLETPHDRSA